MQTKFKVGDRVTTRYNVARIGTVMSLNQNDFDKAVIVLWDGFGPGCRRERTAAYAITELVHAPDANQSPVKSVWHWSRVNTGIFAFEFVAIEAKGFDWYIRATFYDKQEAQDFVDAKNKE